MKHWIDSVVARVVARWALGACAHASLVIAGAAVVTSALLVYTALFLGVNSDNLRLVPEDMPSRIAQREFSRHFPNLDNALLIVVDGETPELVREATDALLAALRADRTRFTEVYVPGGGPFFERNGLLYRSVDELDVFADQMARIQPVLAELERDPGIANFARMVKLALEQVRDTGEGRSDWPLVLDRVGDATVAVYEEYPVAVSWEEVLLQGSRVETARRRVLIAHPILEFDDFLAAGSAIRSIRQTATRLGIRPEHGVKVRVTGNPALNYEEMIGLAWDIGGASVFCFLIVAGILYLALRSLRLVIASVVTLLAGLVWTAAFATAAVGQLNLISISFAVLFIGLGVDFAIHLGMRYASLRQRGSSNLEAIEQATQSVGPSLMICTVTTVIGFFVFVPTDYKGVAELGLIAGTGMIIILGLTLFLFPALLSKGLGIPDERIPTASLHFDTALFGALERRPILIRVVALATGLAALAILPRGHFDSNPINMRDLDTESVQAFNDLLDDGDTSPWFVNLLAEDEARALEIREEVEALDVVRRATLISDYVPDDQEEKLEILSDVSLMLDAPAAPIDPSALPGTAEQIASLKTLHVFLDSPWVDEEESTLGESMRILRGNLTVFLERIERGHDPAEALASFEELMLSNFPAQVARLREAIFATEIRRDDLPPELVSRMQVEDGTTRIQVFPRDNLQDGRAIDEFVDAVRAVDPGASGVAVNLVDFKRTVVASFQQAVLSAFCVVALLIFALWRNGRDTIVVMLPQLLAASVTGACVILFGLSFNFCNVIVIPLLFGIGVDSGIHLVHRSKEALGKEPLLGTTTARAVFYSALTTTVSFGSLALSSHRGVASLGVLLAVGMAVTVVCNLVVLPALIPRSRREAGAAASS